MDEFIDVGPVEDFPPGSRRMCVVNERRIAFFHTASGLFATDNTCPHRGGPLAEGDLIGDEIICPWHLWTFDVRSGKTEADPEIFVCIHQTRVEDSRVLVRLSPSREVPESI